MASQEVIGGSRDAAGIPVHEPKPGRTRQLYTVPWGKLTASLAPALQKLNIGGKLTLGFGVLVALMLLVVALNYLGSIAAVRNINRTTDLSAPIYFDFDRAGIKESERPKLQKAKEYLDANPTHRVLFEGHCDWRGTAEYNLGLGDRRAAAAKKYIETLGVPAARVEVVSKGDLGAIENGSDADMAKDRRVDIIFITK